jgi:hypothetical protein
MDGRLIAIGDIHGCYAEFGELLDRLAPTGHDRLVLLGDLVNRGPDSTKVVDLARAAGALSLLGNHERRLLNFRRTGNPQPLKENDQRTIAQLRPEDWTYLEAMPLTHHIPELDTVLVHGGFVPGEPWQQQPASVVTRVQVIDRDGRPRRRVDCPDCPSWADLWNGPPVVIYGHTPRAEIYRLEWSVGIDTACVMGGHLTAFILPERRFVQVKAHRQYYAP